MTFKEIASRITGISVPVFGVSWNPSKSNITIAREVINFLEDRRVLYNPYELENPHYCYESVLKIREFLTEKLNEVKKDSDLESILRGMRAACRKVMDGGSDNENLNEINYGRLGSFERIMFSSAIGLFRGTMGILIAKMAIMYGIDFEGNLASIIPMERNEE